MTNYDKALPMLTMYKLFVERVGDYQIPIYQRNYDWGKGQIDQLIADIASQSQNDKGKNYYLGTLVLYPRENGQEVLDGQQRLTTLQLLVFWLRAYLGEPPGRSVLHYEARDDANDALTRIQQFSGRHSGGENMADWLADLKEAVQYPAFTEALDWIDGAMRQHVLERSGKASNKSSNKKRAVRAFKDYFFDSTKLLSTTVPARTDVTHYFEVMNNRGEQLESHEVVKARLLGQLENQKERDTLQKVWLACADRHRYVQMGFSRAERNAIFENEDTLRLNAGSFDKLMDKMVGEAKEGGGKPAGDNDETKYLSLSEILKTARPADSAVTDKNGPGERDDSERFTNLIDFPNFLMQVLRIFVMEQGEKDKNKWPQLDDKNLIKAFDCIDTSQKVKDFAFTLLKLRFLFDTYVIKREKTDNKSSWSLKRFKQRDSGPDYVLTFGSGNEESAGRRCRMLQAAFHVSNPAFSYKNWLSAVLWWLNERTKTGETIEATAYIHFLERLARHFMCQYYLNEPPTEYKDFLYEETHEPSGWSLSNLRQYPAIAAFVFNYLDYLLWLDEHGQPEVSNQLKKFRKQFEFRANDTVEHFYPRHPRNLPKLGDSVLNSFGNLCLLSRARNSSWNNAGLEDKAQSLRHYQQNGGAPISLKLELMAVQARDWNAEVIRQHEEQMIDILESELKRVEN